MDMLIVVIALEASRMPFCNGEKTESRSDDALQRREPNVDLQATTSTEATSSSAASINERLFTASINDSLPLTDDSMSRSSPNDTSLLSGDASSLSPLASEDVGRSVVTQP